MLEFDRLDQVLAEVDRLLEGHATSGTWTLGQIFEHLAMSFHLTMDNVGAVDVPDAEQARAFDVRRRRFLGLDRFPDGVLVPGPALDPAPDAEASASAERLRSGIRRFQGFDGVFALHPRLGPLSKAEWDAFHRLHCAHHLGFARPTTTDPGQAGREIAST